jgi:hypothetical protein
MHPELDPASHLHHRMGETEAKVEVSGASTGSVRGNLSFRFSLPFLQPCIPLPIRSDSGSSPCCVYFRIWSPDLGLPSRPNRSVGHATQKHQALIHCTAADQVESIAGAIVTSLFVNPVAAPSFARLFEERARLGGRLAIG